MVMPKDPEKRALALQRMSESRKKMFREHPEKLQAMSERTKTQFADPVQRRLHSDIKKRCWQDPVQREAWVSGKRAFYETEGSAFTRQRARETLEHIKQQPGYWDKQAQSMELVFQDGTVQQKMSKTHTQWHAHTGNKEKHRQAMRHVQERPGYRENVARGLATSKKYSRTDIENIVEQLLCALDIEYETQKHIGKWVVDFYIPSKNLVVECDGEYWHQKPEVQERDSRKDVYLAQKGYAIVRLPGNQIRSGNMGDLMKLLAG